MELPSRDSRRSRRRESIEKALQTVRALFRERGELSRGRRARTVLVELPEPIRWGWERYFYLRPDLDRSPDAPALRQILALVQKVETSNRKDFAERDWRRGGKKRPKPHRPRELTEKEFYALEPHLQRQFSIVVHRRKGVVTRKGFVFHKPWMFLSRTRPYYVTHMELPDSEAVSRECEIESRLYGKGWPFRHLLRQWGSHSDWYPPKDDAPPIEFDDDAGPESPRG